MTNNLNPQQQDAVSHHDGPLLIVAGAGSGKTKTLTSRVVELLRHGVPASKIIAITFTNKAAKEMLTRISNSEFLISNDRLPFIGTFHSLGARILRYEARYFGRTGDFVIFDDDDSKKILRKVINRFPDLKESMGVAKLMHEFSKYKSDGLADSPQDYWRGEREEDQLVLSFLNYEAALKNNNAFDFDDLILKPVQVFRNEPSVLQKYQERYHYILVDEYQDTNQSQYQFIKLLAEKYRNICVVGDDAQSIYSFRGSDFRIFLNFEKDWPETKVVLLEENYRSTGNIITAASSLISQNKFQKPKKLWTQNEAGASIKVVEANDDVDEAEWVTDEVKSQKSKVKSFGIAILYRTNAQSRAIEQALIERDIHYEIFGGLKFYERKEIKDVLAGVRLAINPNDEVSRDRIEKTFTKTLSRTLIPTLQEFKPENTAELLGFILKTTNYFNYLRANFPNAVEREENVKALIEFAFNFPEPSDFLEKITLLQATDDAINSEKNAGAQDSRVTLMTIHMAKGLEFDRVFVIGVNEGLLPHQFSYDKADSLEEERRLMYVAMTRAKQELSLSFYNYASRFIYEIPPELTLFVSLKNDKKKPLYDRDDDEIYID